MSIHAKINAETSFRIQSQKRATAIFAISVSILLITLLGLFLGLYILPSFFNETSTIVTYTTSGEQETKVISKKVTPNVSRQPTIPNFAMAKVIATNAPSPISIPLPEVVPEIPSADFGLDNELGDGGCCGGYGASGCRAVFGCATSITGALTGRLYDLKQDRKGKDITYDPSTANFSKIALQLEKRGFSERAFKDFFQAPLELSLTNLSIPFSPAELGPDYFGAKELVKPSGWIAVYQGMIAAPESGRYRFRAASDDYLVLHFAKKRNLVACWPDLQPAILGRFNNGPHDNSIKSPIGSAQLHLGNWVDLKAGDPVEITLAIGERPGVQVGFVLELEKEGETYRKAPDGRKILPLFATHPFTDEDRNEIQARFGSYEFEWENVPVFGIR